MESLDNACKHQRTVIWSLTRRAIIMLSNTGKLWIWSLTVGMPGHRLQSIDQVVEGFDEQVRAQYLAAKPVLGCVQVGVPDHNPRDQHQPSDSFLHFSMCQVLCKRKKAQWVSTPSTTHLDACST